MFVLQVNGMSRKQTQCQKTSVVSNDVLPSPERRGPNSPIVSRLTRVTSSTPSDAKKSAASFRREPRARMARRLTGHARPRNRHAARDVLAYGGNSAISQRRLAALPRAHCLESALRWSDRSFPARSPDKAEVCGFSVHGISCLWSGESTSLCCVPSLGVSGSSAIMNHLNESDRRCLERLRQAIDDWVRDGEATRLERWLERELDDAGAPRRLGLAHWPDGLADLAKAKRARGGWSSGVDERVRTWLRGLLRFSRPDGTLATRFDGDEGRVRNRSTLAELAQAYPKTGEARRDRLVVVAARNPSPGTSASRLLVLGSSACRAARELGKTGRLVLHRPSAGGARDVVRAHRPRLLVAGSGLAARVLTGEGLAAQAGALALELGRRPGRMVVPLERVASHSNGHASSWSRPGPSERPGRR